MLELRNINTYYGKSHILRDLCLKVEHGETVCILGRNGAGKTTTLNTIMGFISPRQGTILLESSNIAGKSSYVIARLGVGLVPQGRRVFRSLTVRENLLLAARKNKDKCDLSNQWDLIRVYHYFSRLKQRENVKADRLSGGEQQMLAIGRALMLNPRLLLMDEPTEGLSPAMVREVSQIIREIKKEISILLVEQNLSFALSLADRVYIITKGAVALEASPKTLQQGERLKEYLGIS